MSRILNLVGFESGQLAELVTNNAIIATDVKRTGSYSMKMTQYGKYGEVGLANGSSFNGKYCVIRFYVYLLSPGMMGNEELFRFHNSTNNLNLRINPGMTLQLFNDTTSLATYSTPLQTGTWYRIELACFPGKAVMLVNGTQAISVSITNYVWTNLFIGSYVNRNSQFIVAYYDDICLTDDFFPGAGEIVNLSPTALTGSWSGAYTDINDASQTTAITNSTAGTIANVTVSSYDNAKTIRAVKPWVLAKDGSVAVRCGNKELSLVNSSTYTTHQGFVTTSKDQASWTSQPDLSIKNLTNTSTSVAEAGVVVEYGTTVEPCLIDIAYADETTSGAILVNSADPILVQFTFKYTGNTDIVQIGEYKLSISSNVIQLYRSASLVTSGTTTLSINTFYTLKFMLASYNSTTLYRLLINGNSELNSSIANSFTTGNVVFTNTITVKNIVLTGDVWYSNVTVVRRSPTGSGSLSNYTGSYTSIAEYPMSTADYITLSTGSGGAYFTISTITQTIYGLKQVLTIDSGLSITIFGETMTAPPSVDPIRQYDYGNKWTSPSEIKLDFSGSSAAKVYNMYFLALVDNTSIVINSPAFVMFA
jgi:hypothetical protein